jgi:hypothetical protein
MLSCNRIGIRTDLYCDRFCNDLHREDFLYYDKDGFELNRAEQKYYQLMNYQLDKCLNHCAFTCNWYTSSDPRLIVDHSVILYRCEYRGDAERQLAVLKESVPQASLLLNTVAKWGFDFALDSIDEHGDVYEVVHIEYDTNIFIQFISELNKIRERIDSMDWHDAADYILRNKSEWQSLRGFAQNDWKARQLLNWSRAEFTEKAI